MFIREIKEEEEEEADEVKKKEEKKSEVPKTTDKQKSYSNYKQGKGKVYR